ncbi:MAG: MFS transporter [Spirochaetota bacterium]
MSDTRFSRLLILTTTILASGMGFLMGSAVNIALPTIQRALDVEITVIQWIANAYALAISGLILLSGSLGDLVGTRRVYNSGIMVFTIGSLASGVAPGATLLVVFRALQGIGAALMIPGSLAIINASFPREERGRVIGLWAGVSGAIAALGPFVGGFLVSISWRLVFFAMVPLGIVTFVLSLLSVPRVRDRSVERVDWAGALLVLVGLAGISFGLIRLPESTSTLRPAVGIAAGAIALAAFVLQEHRHPNPLVPFSIFTRLVTAANLATLLLYFAFQAALFLLSFYLQQLLGYTPTTAGLALLPATALIALLSAPSGSLTDRLGPQIQLVAGPLIVAAGLLYLVLAGATGGSYPARILPGVVLIGAGMVTLIPAITKSALEVPEQLSGTASGVNNAAARLAGLLAVTVIGATLNARFALGLRSHLPGAISDETRATILARSGELLNLTIPEAAGPEAREAAEQAIAVSFLEAFRTGLLVAAGAAIAAALVSVVFLRSSRAGGRDGRGDR